MTDVRALLKAKRQEARITHPYASYSSSGQLRCTVCGLAVKQASMWEGHLGSKAHRVNIMKLREAELLQQQKEKEERSKISRGKRKAEENGGINTKKMRLSDDDDDDDDDSEVSALEAQLKTNGTTESKFSDNFFSDPSRALPASSESDEDEGEEAAVREKAPSPPPAVKSQLDLEFERFQAAVVNAQDEEKEEDRREAYARATVFAEPELADDGLLQGMPVQNADGEDVEELVQKEETAEERQKRIEREERELIMDRLLEEERVQEEADSRVSLLKAKLEALKRQREAKKMLAKGSK